MPLKQRYRKLVKYLCGRLIGDGMGIKMKKTFVTLLALLLLCTSVISLSSCGINGSWENDIATLTFKGETVTMELKDADNSEPVSCSFEIIEEDDRKFIAFTWAENDGPPSPLKLLDGTLSLSEGEDDKGEYIRIGRAMTFYKK